MAELSLLEIPKLKELVRPYGYAVHVHDACGGQSFTLEPVSDHPNTQVYEAVEKFFCEQQLAVDFYDRERLNFVVK